MSSYRATYSDELYHHGIKGQKWGIRRFQNEDGSYTDAGKKRRGTFRDRLKRGHSYSREHSQISQKEHLRLIKNSKKYQKIAKQNDFLRRKYGIDADDGGGGYDTIPTKKLEAASRRYTDNELTLSEMNEEFKNRAKKYADKAIIDKYGDTAISDMNFSGAVDAAATLAVLASIGGIIAIAKK